MSWAAVIISLAAVWALLCIAAAIGNHALALERIARALEAGE